MKTIRHCLLLLPALIGLAVIATSCDDNDSPEWKSYEVKDGKYIETPNPDMIEYELRPGGEGVADVGRKDILVRE